MIQVFGSKKCRDTQAVMRFFKERGMAFSYIDMDIKAPSPGELDSMARSLGGHEALVDKESKAYTNGGYAWKDYDPRDALLEDPGLYKTPLVRVGTKVSLGMNKTFLEGLLKEVK